MASTMVRATVLAAVIAAVAPGVLYLTWPSFAYSGDDLQYAVVIQEQVDGYPYYHPAGGRLFEPELSEQVVQPALRVNPRYLLEQPTSVAVAHLARAAGWQGPVTQPLSVFRALVGSLGVLAVFGGLRGLGVGPVAALLAALGLSVSAAYWTYSTHLDQSMTMVAFVALAFALLVRLGVRGWSARRSAWLALALVCASFYNFTALFATLAFGAAVFCLEPEAPVVRRTGRALAFLLCYGLTALVLTLVAVALMASPADVVRQEFWREALFAGRPEYGVDLARDFVRAALGLGRSQVAFPGVGDSLQSYWNGASLVGRGTVLAFYAVVLAVLLSPVVSLVRSRVHPLWLRVFVPLCVLLHGTFNWLWDPGFIKYWLVPMVAIWIAWGARMGAPERGRGRWTWPLGIGLVAASFVMNLTLHAVPGSARSSSDWIATAERLGRETTPNDLFVSVGAHPLEFHITYFARRNLVSTGLVTYSGGDAAAVVAEQVRRHRAAGGTVYVFSVTAGLDEMAAMAGVTATQLAPAWTLPGVTVYRVSF